MMVQRLTNLNERRKQRDNCGLLSACLKLFWDHSNGTTMSFSRTLVCLSHSCSHSTVNFEHVNRLSSNRSAGLMMIVFRVLVADDSSFSDSNSTNFTKLLA